MTVASLNARLLARKGDARPAPLDTGAGRARPASARPAAGTWPSSPVSSPVSSPASSPVSSSVWPPVLPGEPGGGAHARARVSLRLDDARHRRLRLAAIHLDASLQQLLTHALDQYLAQVAPDCPCMGRGCTAGAGADCDGESLAETPGSTLGDTPGGGDAA